MKDSSSLAVNIGSIQLKNPVITASGTFGYGLEFAELLDLNKIGAVVVKGLSLAPAPGNPPPRIVETAGGMLNSIGLENIGIEAFIRDKLPELEKYDTRIITNIYGTTVEAYAELAERIDSVDSVAGIEVNISCPNVKAGGVSFGIDPIAAANVISEVKKHTTKTVIAKLSPNVTSISSIASSVAEAGADALSLINTLTGMAIDIDTRKPVLGGITGGLSGPAIKPVALRMVWEVASRVDIPVIGIGGIMTAQDAIEFMIAGATAVQVGTATFRNPSVAVEIVDGLADYVKKNNLSNIRELVGSIRI